MGDYIKHSERMQQEFLERGYPKELVSNAVRRALRKDRQELLKDKNRECTFKGITGTIDHTPLASAIRKIIFRHWHLVRKLPGCSDLPRLGLRKTNSVKDIVTKSDIRPRKQTNFVTVGHFKCGACSSCKQM